MSRGVADQAHTIRTPVHLFELINKVRRVSQAMVQELGRGATVDEIASAMGWQRHTVRGLFSGTLKKKLGLTVASAQEERGRVYRITAAE